MSASCRCVPKLLCTTPYIVLAAVAHVNGYDIVRQRIWAEGYGTYTSAAISRKSSARTGVLDTLRAKNRKTTAIQDKATIAAETLTRRGPLSALGSSIDPSGPPNNMVGKTKHEGLRASCQAIGHMYAPPVDHWHLIRSD